MAGNSNLNSAKTARKDEFYTQLTDIEKEMRYYRKHFQGKTVLCNCDDPFESNFFKYFALNFNRLGLKKLIATCYYSSPIAGQQLQYGCDANGQMTFYFEDKGVGENKNKRPYKAVVTQVYDKRVTAVWTCWMWQNCSAPVKMSWWSWRAMAISVRLNA